MGYLSWPTYLVLQHKRSFKTIEKQHTQYKIKMMLLLLWFFKFIAFYVRMRFWYWYPRLICLLCCNVRNRNFFISRKIEKRDLLLYLRFTDSNLHSLIGILYITPFKDSKNFFLQQKREIYSYKWNINKTICIIFIPNTVESKESKGRSINGLLFKYQHRFIQLCVNFMR